MVFQRAQVNDICVNEPDERFEDNAVEVWDDYLSGQRLTHAPTTVGEQHRPEYKLSGHIVDSSSREDEQFLHRQLW